MKPEVTFDDFEHVTMLQNVHLIETSERRVFGFFEGELIEPQPCEHNAEF